MSANASTPSGGGGSNNVNIPQLIQLTQGHDNQQRNQATQHLKFLEENHFSNYILELCRILLSNTHSSTIRQGAGLLLKNCVAGDRSEEAMNRVRQRWLNQSVETRNNLKSTILNVLSVPDLEARNTAVNVISNLALVETLSDSGGGSGGWKELMPCLIQNCLSKNISLMYSSLKCLGQIAENEILHDEISKYSAKILECIAHGMSTKGDVNTNNVQSEAMQCLIHMIELIKSNMNIEKERRIIFQMVCCGASNGPNLKLRLNSFMCISRLIEYHYDLLKPFMQTIFQISKRCIEKDDESNHEVTKQAIEIWSTCAEIECDIMQSESSKRTNHGFVNKCLELLVPIYLNLLKQQKTEFDEDEWTVRKAAACSLELFALVAQDNILKYVLSFVEQNIGLSDWRCREAALCSFGCVLDGPSRQKLIGLVSQILGPVLKLMADTNSQVRTSAVWTFGRICEIIPESTNSYKQADILNAIVAALNDENSISSKACWSIASLTKYYGENRAISGCIYCDQNAYKLISELLKRAERDDSDNTLIIACHEAINSVIFFLPNSSNDNADKQMLKSLLSECVKQMINCTQAMQNNASNISEDLLSYKMAGLFSSVQVILDKMGANCLDSDMSNKIMMCIVTILQKENNLIHEEGLGLIGQVSRCIGDNFNIYLSAENIQNLLTKAIRSGNESICRIAVGVIGDVYTNCSQFICANPLKLQKYTDRIVTELLAILIDQSIGIELKSHIVDALTDTLLAHGTNAHRYSADVLDKCLEIGCLVPPTDADEEVMDIFNEIRCSIVDLVRTCLAELAQCGKINDFDKYIPKINNFFKAISEDLGRVCVDVLKSCIKLLCEAADYCHPSTKKKLQTQFIQKILQKSASYSNEAELANSAKQAFQQLAAV